jgi:hypothetical protein
MNADGERLDEIPERVIRSAITAANRQAGLEHLFRHETFAVQAIAQVGVAEQSGERMTGLIQFPQSSSTLNVILAECLNEDERGNRNPATDQTDTLFRRSEHRTFLQ